MTTRSKIHIVLFLLFVVATAIIGGYYYNSSQKEKRIDAYRSLSTLASIKINQINNWVNRKEGDAEYLFNNGYLNYIIYGYLIKPHSQSRREIIELLRAFIRRSDYTEVVFITRRNRIISLIEGSSTELSSSEKQDVQISKNENRPVVSKMAEVAGNKIRTYTCIPLTERYTHEYFGTLILRTDLRKELFLLVSASPQGSRTAESFIVQQDGDSILYLNSLKFKNNSEKIFKLPLSIKNLPASNAVKGRRGMYIGYDYRRVKVVSDLKAIPGLPWYIISKIDLDEVYSPIRKSALIISSGTLIIIVLFGLLLRAQWKNEKINILQQQLLTVKEKNKLETQLLLAEALAHLGSWELDLEKNILFWSDEVYKIMGLEPQEFAATYEAFLSYVHPDDREAVDDAYTSSLREEKDSYEIEHRILRKDGEIRYVHEKCLHHKNTEGRIIRSVGMVQDITERKNSELALRNSESKLAEAQRLAKLGFYLFDIETETLEWSDELYNIFEVDRSQKIKLDYFWKFVHRKDVEDVKFLLQKGLTVPEILDSEFRIVVNGKVKHISAYSKPIADNRGEVVQIFGTMMDITLRKQAQLNLERTLFELQRSNKDLEHFAYTASHDLQEPIRMVKSYAQLFELKNRNIDEKSKEYLNFINEGASRMQGLVDGLLEYSRLTTKDVVHENVDCKHIAEEVLKDLEIRINETSAVIKVENLPVVKGNPLQLRQLFQNLISNSLKFTCDRIPEIQISCVKDDQNWVFSFVDNGIGIEPQFFDRIFSMFQRLHDREKFPGTGIGLAVCKKIVERHGGHISVISEPGRGTTFNFTIPL